MVMHLTSCCCGCSLKTGSVIIGVLSGIVALVGLVVAIMGASLGTGQLQKEAVLELQRAKDHPDPRLQLDERQLDEMIKNLENSGGSKTLAVVFICLAIVNAIHLILSILLVFGASAERARLVKPWIIYAILSLVVQSVLGLVNIITLFIAGHVLNGLIGLVVLAVAVTIGAYFVLVVNSFHTELRSNNFPTNKI